MIMATLIVSIQSAQTTSSNQQFFEYRTIMIDKIRNGILKRRAINKRPCRVEAFLANIRVATLPAHDVSNQTDFENRSRQAALTLSPRQALAPKFSFGR